MEPTRSLRRRTSAICSRSNVAQRSPRSTRRWDAAMTNDQRSRSKESKPGLVARVATRLSSTELEFEARELQEDAGRQGATPIAELRDRAVAVVCGSVRSVTSVSYTHL